MKTSLTLIIIGSLSAAAISAQPVVTQISNAASASLSVQGPEGTWQTLPNGAIAQGSYFAVYGNGLAADISTCGTGFTNCLWHPYPLPTSIQQTSVSVTIGDNPPVAAYIEFAAQVSATAAQINAVLPSTTPIGSGTLSVTYNGQSSAAVPIDVVASSFGTFAFNQAGSGPGIITDTGYNPLTPFHTAKPGDYVLLWGTGLGPAPNISTEQTQAPPQTNLCASATTCPVTVWVGGKQATVPYAGRAGYTAEDQIVFIVPGGLQGCYVQVAVVASGVTSNFTSMPVDPNGAPCSDTNGVNMNYINGLVSANGSAKIGTIGLLSQLWNINFSGTLVQWDNDTVNAQIGTFSPAALDSFQGFAQMPSVNNCSANTYQGYPPALDPGLGLVTQLDAGAALSIQSPITSIAAQPVPQVKSTAGTLLGYEGLVGGATALPTGNVLAQQGDAPFFWVSTPNGDGTFTESGLSSGNYTVTGDGGATVGPFTATLDVSPAVASFVWTNASTFNDPVAAPQIPRDTPLNITWSGGDPQGFVNITLIGSTVLNTLPSPTTPEPGVQVVCIVPGNLGSFNVPTYVLQSLPPVGDSGSPISGLVMVGPASAPVKVTTTPTGLDAAYMYFSLLSGYTVQWE